MKILRNHPPKLITLIAKPFFALVLLALISLTAANAQQSVPGFSASLSPDTIGPGSTTTLTYQIDNTASNEAVSNLDFSITLPAGVTIATPSVAFTDCIGRDVSLTAPDGGSTLTFTGGAVGAGQSCVVRVNVTGTTAGLSNLSSSDLTSSAGNSGPASADLTVATDRPGFTKSFSASPVSIGDRLTLKFTFDNSANNAAATNLSFTDVLPTGLEVAGPANATTDCTGGVITAVPGSNTISYGPTFTGQASVAAGAICTLSVEVIATAVGRLENITGELTTFNGQTRSSGMAGAVLNVTPPPVILFTKQFIDDPVSAGSTATLEFTIQNVDRENTATDIAFTDDLNAVLSGLVAVAPLPTDPCGNGSTLTGTSLLSLSGGSLDPETSCTFQVTVQVPGGATAGQYPNTTSSLTATFRGDTLSIDPASDTLFVNEAPVLTKAFLDSSIIAGGTTTIEFSITNNGSSTATDIAFTDNLSVALSGARDGITVTGIPADGFCGPISSLTFIPATNPPPPSSGTDARLILTGGELGAGQTCTFQVALGTPLDLGFGTFTNTTDPLTATVGNSPVTGKSASADLEVVSGVNLAKEFTDDPVAPGDTATLQFTLSLDPTAPGDATNIAFTDDLGAVIAGLASTSGTLTDICGAGSQITGTSTLSFTGGTLSPGESCTFSVQVSVPAATASGTYPNSTSNVMGTISGLETQGEPGEDALLVSGLTFTKDFIDGPVIPGGTATLRFSLDNTNGTTDVTGIQFTDDLDDVIDGLVAVGTFPETDICGSGSSLIALSGNSFIQLIGGSLDAGESCDFDVTVQVPANAPSGTYNNSTSFLAATIDGNPTALPPATAELQVTGNLLALSKAFTSGPAAPGGIATLEFTLTNLDMVNPVSGVTFTDNLDAVIPGLASISGTQLDACGAGSELSGTGLLTLVSGSLGAGETCTFSAQVLIPANADAGSYPNTTSSVSGTITGLAVTGDPASASLEVGLITFSKRFISDSIQPGGVATLEFTIENNSAGTVSNIGFTDDLDLMIPGATAIGTPISDVCGTGSTLMGTSILSLSNGELLPAGSCTFSVDVQIPANALLGDRTNTTSDLSVGGLPAAPPATAVLYVDSAGDTPEDALEVVVDPQTGTAWVNAVLRPGDIDYFSFTLAAAATVQVSSSGGLDTVGEFFDDAGNLLNDPVADGDSGTGSNFQSTLTLGPGTYFVKVTGVPPGDDGPYMFHIEQSGAELNLRPDLLISKLPQRRHFKGNNIYNRNAHGQKIIILGLARANRVKKFYWAVQNDGLDDDNIRLRFRPNIPGPSHPRWRVRITKLTGGSTNVTAAFRAGPVDVDLAPADHFLYKVEFTLRNNSNRLVRRSFRIGGRSNLDTTKLDVVGGTIRLFPVH